MRYVWLLAVLAVAGVVSAEEVGDDFFVEKLYPELESAQCRACHGENGVASGTRLHFPPAEASRQQIAAFGSRLRVLVDSGRPDQSLLLLKPTNRTAHTGGERIRQSSEAEKLLQSWVKHLSAIPGTERAAPAVKEHQARRPAVNGSPHVRRLTHRQYNNTVRDLLGDRTQPANQFPPEDFIHGFKNQLEGQSVPPLLAEAYSLAAENLARAAFPGRDRNQLIPCGPVSPEDSACRMRFIQRFGRKAFRRPLSAAEVKTYDTLFLLDARREKDFLAGARIVVEAMLQSPSFLFRSDSGRNSALGDFANASRLSYFLWDTMPDEELLERAERGELRTARDIESTARRMLSDPRAKPALEEFLAQWLRFDRVVTAVRDRRLYRAFNSELAAAMMEETKRLFNHLVWEDRDFLEFYTAGYSFINPDLAQLYGLPPPAEGFAKVTYPESSGRAGILGQALFHTITSKPAETSPTERGLFVREHFLCQDVPPPPPGVNANLPPATDEKPMTNRERLQAHLTSPACAGCHRLVDSIGFGFEQYDAIGRFREKQRLVIYPTRDEEQKGLKKKPTEFDLALDTSGVVAGIPDSAFSTPKELGTILAQTPACQKCVVKQLFRYAFNRQETAADQEVVDRALKRFAESGFRFQELIVSLVVSPAFLGERES